MRILPPPVWVLKGAETFIGWPLAAQGRLGEAIGAAGGRTSTRLPASIRYWPSVTTRSLVASPVSTIAIALSESRP